VQITQQPLQKAAALIKMQLTAAYKCSCMLWKCISCIIRSDVSLNCICNHIYCILTCI